MRRKAANVKGDMEDLIGGLHWYTFGSYVNIRQNVDQLLFTVSSQLKKMLGREGKTLQHSVHDTLHDATGSVRHSFVEAFKIVDRNLSLIVGHSGRL